MYNKYSYVKKTLCLENISLRGKHFKDGEFLAKLQEVIGRLYIP